MIARLLSSRLDTFPLPFTREKLKKVTPLVPRNTTHAQISPTQLRVVPAQSHNLHTIGDDFLARSRLPSKMLIARPVSYRRTLTTE